MVCKITAPDKNKVFNNVTSVSLPSQKGRLQILPNHAESFILLDEGKLAIESQSGNKNISIPEGVCYVKGEEVLIIL